MKRATADRRSILKSIFTSALGGSLSTVSSTVSAQSTETTEENSGNGWPMYSYDARNSASAHNRGPLGSLSVEWSFDEKITHDSSVAAREGELYFVTNSNEPSRCYALDAETGSEIWSYELQNSNPGTPVVTDNQVFIIGSNENFDNTEGIIALRRNNGSVEWSRHEGDYNTRKLTLADETLYALKQTSMLAIDPSSGDVQWEFSPQYDFYSTSAPAVAGDKTYVSPDNTLYAVNSASGSKEWEISFDQVISNRPMALSDRVLVYSDSSIYSVDAETGTEEWVFDLSEYSPRWLTVWNDIVITTKPKGLSLLAINVDDGTEAWSTRIRNLVNHVKPRFPVVSNGYVYVAMDNHANQRIYEGNPSVVIFDAEMGEEVGRYEVNSTGPWGLVTRPIVYRGRVYIGNQTGEGGLFALEGEKTSTRNRGDASEDGNTISSSSTNNTTVGTASDNSTDGTTANTANTADSSSGLTSPVAILRRFSDATGSPLLWALGGIGGTGVAYATYQKLASDDNEDKQTAGDRSNSIPPSAVDRSQADEPTITDYSDLELLETVEQASIAQIQRANVDSTQIWVLTPDIKAEATVSATTAEKFANKIEPWSKMDRHPNLTSVFKTGIEPLPWAAIEPIDHPQLIDHVDQFSTNRVLEVVQQICDAVHHVYRYGTTYESLTTASVLYSDSSDIKLRGILDQFQEDNTWYKAPEEFETKSTERSVVYRLGLITYELLTGELPYTTYPDGTPKEAIKANDLVQLSEKDTNLSPELNRVLVKSLSKTPKDRYETVLHFRDDLRSLNNN